MQVDVVLDMLPQLEDLHVCQNKISDLRYTDIYIMIITTHIRAHFHFLYNIIAVKMKVIAIFLNCCNF